MHFVALVSFVCAIISAFLAQLWKSAPQPAAEHWTVRRKRLAKIRAGRMSALYLGMTAILLSGAAEMLGWR